MKVLALNGSHRGDKGTIGRMLQSMGAGVVKAGANWQVIHLSKLNIETCRACSRCQNTKTYKCVFDGKDDTEEVFNEMKDADILIYASPVYVFGVSSLLKRLLERLHSHAPVEKILLTQTGLFFHETDRSIAGKPFVSIVVCDNLENLTVRNASEYFRIFGRFMDAKRLAHLERRSAAAWMAALEATGHPEKEKAKSILDAYACVGEELVLKGCVTQKTKKMAQQSFIKIPLPIRMARHVPVFRPLIEKEVKKRAESISHLIGVK